MPSSRRRSTASSVTRSWRSQRRDGQTGASLVRRLAIRPAAPSIGVRPIACGEEVATRAPRSRVQPHGVSSARTCIDDADRTPPGVSSSRSADFGPTCLNGRHAAPDRDTERPLEVGEALALRPDRDPEFAYRAAPRPEIPCRGSVGFQGDRGVPSADGHAQVSLSMNLARVRLGCSGSSWWRSRPRRSRRS